MRNALFRMIRWNRLAAGRMTATHRNERELRGNLLVAIGQLLEQRRRFWLPVPIGRDWPEGALCAPGGAQPDRATDSEANRIIPLADRLRRADSVGGGTSQGKSQ